MVVLGSISSLGASQDLKISQSSAIGYSSAGSPVLHPDGQRVFFLATGALGSLELFVGSLDGAAGLSSISGPLIDGGGIVDPIEITSDGTQVIYRSDAITNQRFELFQASIAPPHLPTRLHPELPSDRDVAGFELDPSGPWVVYRADQEVDNRFELYRVPLDGSAAPTKLNAPLTSGSVGWAGASPDGSMLVYLAYTTTGWEIWSVPMDGSGMAVLMATATTSGGAHLEDLIAVSPDSSRVVYVADALVAERHELFSVPIDGSAPPTKLNGTLTSGGDVVYMDAVTGRFAISPDSSRVVYQADQLVDGDFDLFSVPIDGGTAAVQLNGPAGGNVAFQGTFQISPDSTRVVYLGAEDGPNIEIFSVPLDGSASWTRLNNPGDAAYITFSVGGSIFRDLSNIFRISPDGSRVVYRARFDGVRDLYSAPILGGAPPVKLSGPMVVDGDVAPYDDGKRLSISPDGSRVVYIADQDVDEIDEVYSAPIDGSSGALKLNTPLDCGTTWEVVIDPTSARVVFRMAQPGMFSLYNELRSAAIDAGADDVVLSVPTLSQGAADVEDDFSIAPDGRAAFFRGNLARSDAIELFRAPLSGATPQTKISSLPALCLSGGVETYRTSPDGTWMTYLAEDRTPFVTELFSVSMPGPPQGTPPIHPPLVLNLPLAPGADVTEHEVSPAGDRVLFTVRDADTSRSLYSAPIDGSTNAVLLAGPYASLEDPAAQITPDGTRIVFLDDLETPGLFELYSAPMDGTGAPVKLNGTLVAGGGITLNSIVLDPTSANVVYRADQDIDSVFELYSVPVDGSASPIKLNLPLSGNLDVLAQGHRITPDGTRVIYLSDQVMNNVNELYSVPIDGSSTPLKLNGTLAAGGDVLIGFQIAGDSSRVVYRADQLTNGVIELFSAPVDGSQPAIRLNAPPVLGGDVFLFEIAPDSSRVVFTGDLQTSAVTEVFSAPVDGTSPALKVSGSMVTGGSVGAGTRAFGITHDSRRVVYLADQELDERSELFGAPLDGSLEPRKLNGPLVSGGGVEAFALGAGNRVAYLADQDVLDQLELYSSPLAPRARSLSRAQGPFAGGNTVLLEGEGFTEDTTVAFDGVPADVTLVDAQRVSVVAPPTPTPGPSAPSPGPRPTLSRLRMQARVVNVEVSDGVSIQVLRRAYTYADVKER